MSQPAPSSSASSSSIAAAQTAHNSGVLCSLRRDEVQSVLQFLSLSDLCRAAAVCQLWLSALRVMKPTTQLLRFGLQPPGDYWADRPLFMQLQRASLASACSSLLLSRFIHTLDTTNVELTASSLHAPSASLPSLHVWRGCVMRHSLRRRHGQAQAEFDFPPRLEELEVECDATCQPDSEGGPIEPDLFLAALGRLQRLSKLRLRMTMGFERHETTDYHLLEQLQQLTSFTFDGYLAQGFFTLCVPASLLSAIRSWPLLTRLHLFPDAGLMDAKGESIMERLTAEPHQLQLEEFTFGHSIFSLHADKRHLLRRLPSLTTLAVECSDWGQFDFLSSLPQLTELSIYFPRAVPDDVDREVERFFSLIQPSSHPRLHSLGLHSTHLTADHLARHLPLLPQLDQLTFDHCDLPHLRFLHTDAMRATLKELRIVHCHGVPHTLDVLHFHQLQQLESLELLLADRERRREDIEAMYDPDSAACVLPRLRHFCYTTVFYPRQEGQQHLGAQEEEDEDAVRAAAGADD